MSTAVAEPQELKLTQCEKPIPEAECPVNVTERASRAVKDIVADQRATVLGHLVPEFVAPHNAFVSEHGRAPNLNELTSAAGISDQDFLVKLGAAAFAKNEHLSQEHRELYRELNTANGRAPTSAELAARAGVTEQELLTKIGNAAGTILGKVFLRLSVVGGGCSGFKPKLDLDPSINPKMDEGFEVHGVSVAIDKRSIMYLQGAIVDYHDDLNRRGFSVVNPAAKSTCGCGSSFSM